MASTNVFDLGGGSFKVTSTNAAPVSLPAGTYTVSFNPMSGYTIVTLPTLQEPGYRVYGRRDSIIDKVKRTYTSSSLGSRSLGILFEGDKGIGKSSTSVELARQMMVEFGLPVFMINHDSPGLSDFLSSLGECVIVFDEFEKNFPDDGDGDSSQNQFLTLFDGTDATKRLYIVTVNEKSRLSEFFINRPGRFHYLISFDYPNAEEIFDYISNETSHASAKQIADATSFAYRARLNYDHLRAIVTELNIADPDESVSSLVADLNIRDTELRDYDVVAILEDGTKLSMTDSQTLELFSPDDVYLSFPLGGVSSIGSLRAQLVVSFPGSSARLDNRTGKINLSGDSLEVEYTASFDVGVDAPDWIPQKMTKKDSYGFIDVRVPGGEFKGTPLANLEVNKIQITPAAPNRGHYFL